MDKLTKWFRATLLVASVLGFFSGICVLLRLNGVLGGVVSPSIMAWSTIFISFATFGYILIRR